MTTKAERPDLSIVATMYKSEVFIHEFCDRILAASEKITPNFEIVLVNDGSPDACAEIIRRRCEEDHRFVLVDLSRNFGHHAAIIAGLEAAEGKRVYLTDSDLEEQPEWILDFWEKADERGVDVVYGVQEYRTGKRLDNFLRQGLWRLLDAGTSVRIPENQMTCRMMSREYVESLRDVRDRVIYLGGLFPWAGYHQVPLLRTKTPRTGDIKSTYGLVRKLRQIVDSITSFTAAPLTAFFVLGVVIWLGSLAYGVMIVLAKLIYPDSIVSGFTSVMFSLWFLGGLIILGIGIVGQYVSKIFQEVKARPRYIVRSITRGKR